MRIVVDYRPALKARTGVGEYIHEVVSRLCRSPFADDITIFSSSWKDRPSAGLGAELPGSRIVDRRVPVQALNLAWHRFNWPPIEILAGSAFDVAHSPHPLLLPARNAAQVVTVHDLHFMAHPERTQREIQRDYPALAGSHARRADAIIVSSKFAAGEVQRILGVPAEKIALCPAGAPAWATAVAGGNPDGYLLFLGTLERRKNVGGLLDAYSRLLSRRPDAPALVLAGGSSDDAAPWLERITRAPLAGHVEYTGYIDANRRVEIFRDARAFLLPSFEEGFGLTALEAMAAGVPVVASRRGSLPEVVGDAGLLIDPEDVESLTSAIERVVSDAALWRTLQERGRARAREFTWEQTARDVRRAYEAAVVAHTNREAHAPHAHRN